MNDKTAQGQSKISNRGRKVVNGIRVRGTDSRLSRDIHPGNASESHKAAIGERSQFLKGNFAGAVKSFRKTFDISQEELARITGFSTRSIAGWERGESFSAAGRQKLVEMERLRTALAEIIPPAAVGDWLRQPNPAFENQPPLQVMERGEADRIWRMIFQIDAGVTN